jgi:hypothetical protein
MVQQAQEMGRLFAVSGVGNDQGNAQCTRHSGVQAR